MIAASGRADHPAPNTQHMTMKPIKPILITLTIAATTLWLAGCKPHDHDHAGHDHSGHDHGDKPATKAPASGGTASAINEKPTKEQIAAAKPYPLDVCAVSGEKLGSMGEPAVVLVGDQVVKLCCGGCMDDVKADPAKVLSKLVKQP